MPELPEVETILRKLSPHIQDAVIKTVSVRRPDLRFPIPKNLSLLLQKARVTSLTRRSKYLCIHLSNQQTLIIHLGMTGRLYICEADRKLEKHDHVLFDFTNGKHLRFLDPRRFGFVDVAATDTLKQHKFFSDLGVEPLSDDFSPDVLRQICSGKQSPIKSVLMNAKHVVGVGNIYACEALFLAGISPLRLAHSLRTQEIQNLCRVIKKVLQDSISSGGTSFRDYVDVDEKPGLHQISLKVYQRESEPCLVCGKPIVRVVQANRSSFYCKNCQK